MTSASSLRHEAHTSGARAPSSVLERNPAMRSMLHVLSVGSIEECNHIRDALLERQRCRMTAVNGANGLYGVPREEMFDVAVLHPSLSATATRDAGAVIRRRWPATCILALTWHSDDLEDALYDEWSSPLLSHAALIELLERLAPPAAPSRHAGLRTSERKSF